ncbi:MAG: hypothetical protein V4519_02515 [Patescibacteria group bacterium]
MRTRMYVAALVLGLSFLLGCNGNQNDGLERFEQIKTEKSTGGGVHEHTDPTVAPKKADEPRKPDEVFKGAPHPSVVLTTRLWSQYYGANGSVYHTDPVLQSDVFVTFPNGVYIDLWHSAGLDDANLNSNFGDEVDYTLGWVGKVRDVNVNVGVSYFDLAAPRLLSGTKGDLIYMYGELSLDLDLGNGHTIKPFLKPEAYLSANATNEGFEGQVQVGVNHIWQVNESVSFQHRLAVLADPGFYGFDSGLMLFYSGGVAWKLSDSITLDLPVWKMGTPITSMSDSREFDGAIGVGLTIKLW